MFSPLASVGLNEAKRVNNGNKAAEDSPAVKKMRTGQRKGPEAAGKDADGTNGKQGHKVTGQGGMGQLAGLSKSGMIFLPSLFEDIINLSIIWAFGSTSLLRPIFLFIHLSWIRQKTLIAQEGPS